MEINGARRRCAIVRLAVRNGSSGDLGMFADRNEAGRKLARSLPEFEHGSTLVVALPRGGVPVAQEVASALDLPLDILLVRKVGAPGYPEVAVGAICDGDDMRLTVNRDIAGSLGLDDGQVGKLAQKVLPELERRKMLYCGDRPPLSVKDKTVIIVDDGAATGATLRVALTVLRERGAKRLIVALPVAPAEILNDLRRLADDVICLESPSSFRSVGDHYGVFDQVGDQEVIRILAQMETGTDHP
jgi:putative phosphoribosyl transferase